MSSMKLEGEVGQVYQLNFYVFPEENRKKI